MQQLKNLVETLEIQQTLKRDIIVPAQGFHMWGNGDVMIKDGFQAATAGSIVPAMKATDVCHNQIAEKLGIPTRYYRRMQGEKPELLAANVNGWFAHDEKTKYLLRTFRGTDKDPAVARALLSDRYNALDNYDVLLAGLEAIKKMGVNVDITKATVTDKKLYLHVTCPEVEIEAEAFLREYLKENDAAGNGIYSGFVLTNSEVGEGSFEIRPRAVICKCNNGLIMKDDSFRKIHLGSKLGEGEIKWSDNTRRKNYELIIAQTQDAIKTFLSKDYVGQMVQKIADAASIKLDNAIDTVHNVCKELSISEGHKRGILDFFLQDGDHKASGVVHAVTRQAQKMDADSQYEVETSIFELLPRMKSFDKPFSKS